MDKTADRTALQLVEEPCAAGWAQAPRPRTVQLLEVDPRLRACLSPSEFVTANRYAVAPLVELRAGEFDPHDLPQLASGLGALVLEGVILRQVRVGNRDAAELIGPGDLIRPLDADDGRDAPVPYDTTWCAVKGVRLAVLDARFIEVAARWPALLDVVLGAMAARARSSTVLLAISQLGGLDLRVHTLLWHLADRFGRVERDGVVIGIPLTHMVLSRLAGAQRPPVTMALNRLRRQGLIRRDAGGCWVLQGGPPLELLPAQVLDAAS